MAYDSITDSKVKYLIVHDVLGYVYFFGINQVNKKKRSCLSFKPLIYIFKKPKVSSVWARKRHASAVSSTKSQPNDLKLELTIVYQTKLLINPKSLIIDDLSQLKKKKINLLKKPSFRFLTLI